MASARPLSARARRQIFGELRAPASAIQFIDQPAGDGFDRHRHLQGAARRARSLASRTRDSLLAAAWRLAEPEGDRRSRPRRPRHADARRARRRRCGRTGCRAGRCRRQCFRSRSLIQRCGDLVLGLEENLIVGIVGNSAAEVLSGGQPRAPRRPRSIDRPHRIVVDQRPAPAASGREPVAQRDPRRRLGKSFASGRGMATSAGRARRVRPPSVRARATSATICCARTSSGQQRQTELVGSPRRDAVEQAGTRPTGCARAERDSPWGCRRRRGRTGRPFAGELPMERGDPNWQTRSTSADAMPSSSEEVATNALNSPFFSCARR